MSRGQRNAAIFAALPIHQRAWIRSIADRNGETCGCVLDELAYIAAGKARSGVCASRRIRIPGVSTEYFRSGMKLARMRIAEGRTEAELLVRIAVHYALDAASLKFSPEDFIAIGDAIKREEALP